MADIPSSLSPLLAKHPRLAIAFSGGVDSAFLAAVAKKTCDSVMLITVDSEFQSRREMDHASATAKALGLPHTLIQTRVLDHPSIRENPTDRCFHCKQHLFSLVKSKAEALGFTSLAHGANLDDSKDFRPGFRAAQEAGFMAPLLAAGLTKSQIRVHAKQLGLEVWNRPSQSCLAARIPYTDPITQEKLNWIEKGEAILADHGFERVRLRCHGQMARIEVDPDQLDRFGEKTLRQTLIKAFRAIGFQHISLDLEGYTTGSLNRCLAQDQAGGEPGDRP